MSFDPDAYLAKKKQSAEVPAFDPDAYLASKGADPNKPLEAYEEPGFLASIGQGIVKAGQFVDSYTGAPTRSAIGAAQEGKNPLSAFVSQFGGDPTLAPTGKQIAERAGVSTEESIVNTADQRQAFDERYNPGLAALIKKSGGYQDQKSFSPAGMIGLGIDASADLTNIIPGAFIARNLVRGGAKGAEMLGRGVKTTVNAAADAAKTSKVGNAVVETAKATKAALDDIFKPKQADDFMRWVDVAQRNGIDPTSLPESIEFGQGSVVSRVARSVREGPVGQADMERFQDGVLQVNNAVDRKVINIGGGLPLNDIEAGDVIRKGFDDSVDELFNKVDFTYNSVIQQAPGAVITPDAYAKLTGKINELESFAQGQLAGAITKSEAEQAKQLLRAVNGLRKRFSDKDAAAGTFGTLRQLYEAMAPIGRHAFKKGGTSLADVPVDQKKFQEMYFAMREAFINSTATQLGDDVAQALVDSNQQITMFMKNKEPIAKMLENKQLAPEKLFKSLISGGDTTKIQALREMLTPEQFNQLKGAYLESLITRNSDETINFGALRTRIQKNRSIISNLFEPDEIREVAELVLLGEKFGPAVLSTSGTGGSNIFRNLLEGVQSGATNRTTLDLMKQSARQRGLPEGGGQLLLAPSPLRDVPVRATGTGGPLPSLPRRTTPEEIAKYLQIVAAQEGASNKDKEAAAKRRLEGIKRLRGAGQ